jgi:hypothetical protein
VTLHQGEDQNLRPASAKSAETRTEENLMIPARDGNLAGSMEALL